MSSSMYRSQLKNKQNQRLDAEKRVSAYRKTEAEKRARATKAEHAARTSKSPSTVQSKLREADRYATEADRALKSASDWQGKAATYGREEAVIQRKLLEAEQKERAAEERKLTQARNRAERQMAAEQARVSARVDQTYQQVTTLRTLRAARPEKLRVLLLGASPEGDLRIGREQARIRKAVEAARHRDLVEFDVRTSATTDDLLDGVTKFRPHVVHFSGHSDSDVIQFERDIDACHEGLVVSDHAFAAAISATDDPPLLVFLNSCNSAEQAESFVDGAVPFAIGMSDTIGDTDAISYAAQFYAAVTNGQSVQAAHKSGRAALELAGLDSVDLPVLFSASDADPSTAVLVIPPHEQG